MMLTTLRRVTCRVTTAGIAVPWAAAKLAIAAPSLPSAVPTSSSTLPLQHSRCTSSSSKVSKRKTKSTAAEGVGAAVDEVLGDTTSTVSTLISSEEIDAELDAQALPSIVLRPYQEEAIEACLSALDRGLRRIGVSSPTGSGKTTMFMNLIPQVKLEDQKRTQTLILVGSVELALQAEGAAKRILGDQWSVEVEQSKRIASGNADVTIATYQTLSNPERLKKFDPSRFKLVIVDEAHHAAALSYLRLLHYFNDAVELPQVTGPYSTFDHGDKVPVIGFSATFSRHDQLALNAAFEEIVFHRDVGLMLKEGWLSPVKSTAVYADLDLETVNTNGTGDFNANSLAKHVNTEATNLLLVRTWLHQASKQRRSTLVFAVNLAHVRDLVDTFRLAGVDARSISSHTAPAERKATIAAFANGEFPVLVNCEVLTEGADIREIDCIVLARPTKSKNLLAQMVGRGLRLSPETNKENCHLIDLVDNITRSGGLAVDPTLLGLRYEDGVSEDPEDDARTDDYGDEPPSSTNARNSQGATVKKVTLVDIDDPFGLNVRGKTAVAAMSPNAWVNCGNDRYVLDIMMYGAVLVDFGGELWDITFEPPKPIRSSGDKYFKTVRIPIAQADTLERAIQSAEKYVSHKVSPEQSKMFLRSAPWRTKKATDKQLASLCKQLKMVKKKVAGTGAGEAEDEVKEVMIAGQLVPTDKLNAGQVNALFTGMSYGARGQRRKIDDAEARAEAKARRKEEKAQALAARNLPLPSA